MLIKQRAGAEHTTLLTTVHRLLYALRIRQLLLVIFFVLAAVAVSAMTLYALQTLDWSRRVQELVDANAIGQKALSLSAQLARERGLTATFLADQKQYTGQAHRRLQSFRDSTDEELEALSLELKQRLNFPIPSVYQKLEKVAKTVPKLRASADLKLSGGSGQISYGYWLLEVTKCIDQIADINRNIRAPRSESEHATRYGTHIKQLFFEFSEFLGRERALLSAAIAQQRPLTPIEYRELDKLQYAQETVWQAISNILEFFPETPGLTAALDNLRVYYLGEHQRLRAKVIESSQSLKPYPLHASVWFDKATQGVDAVLALAQAVDDHIDEDVGLVMKRNRSQVIVLVVAMILVALVFTISLWVTFYRILNPLRVLHQSAKVISTGDLSRTVPVETRDEFGEVAAAFEVMRNYLFNDRKLREKAEDELRSLIQAIEQSFSSVVISGIDGIMEYANPQFYRATGYQSEEIIGSHVSITRPDNASPELYREIWEGLQKGEVWQGELPRKRKNGELYWDLCSISPVSDRSGKITHVISIHHDVTDQKMMAERLNFLAYHDELTELPSRALLIDRFDQMVSHAQRNQTRVGLLVLGLDRFKLINESLGLQVGDQLLIAVARRLSEAARSCDTLARYAGDKFVFLIEDVECVEVISDMVRRLLEVFNKPFVIGKHELYVDVSAGGSVWPEDGKEVDTLLRKADTAMYQVKSSTEINFQLFTDEMNRQITRRLKMEIDIRKGLEERQFELYFQPQVGADSGNLEGVEALIRWHHPELGLVSPLDFIAVAEDTGLIRPIGKWVLEQACELLARWRMEDRGELSVAINVSVRQLEDDGFATLLSNLIERGDFSPENLELEITESVVMGQPEKMLEVLRLIKKTGVQLALDDFGTGYSSLSYLRRFPFDKVKIDRSFIKEIVSKPEDVIIAKAITEMAHSLNMRVLAEGVENEIQAESVRRCCCDQIQGYLVSPPVPLGQFEQQYQLS